MSAGTGGAKGSFMEITVNFGFVNWFAVLAATLAVFVFGGLWYSPMLFGRSVGVVAPQGESDAERGSRGIEWIFVAAFLLWWLAASIMAAVLGPNSTMSYGLQVGLLIGLCLVTPAMGVTYIFEKRGLRFWLVNGGYHTLAFGIIGTIVGAWH